MGIKHEPSSEPLHISASCSQIEMLSRCRARKGQQGSKLYDERAEGPHSVVDASVDVSTTLCGPWGCVVDHGCVGHTDALRGLREEGTRRFKGHSPYEWLKLRLESGLGLSYMCRVPFGLETACGPH